MKDSLKDLFSERFQCHEAPVDPATWQVIEARLLTSAPATDQVNDLFRDRFEQHEVSVDPSVWQGISSQLGHGAAAGSGLFGGFGWVAAGVAAVLVAGGLYYFSSGTNAELSSIPPANEQHTTVVAEPVVIAQEQEPVATAPSAEVAAPAQLVTRTITNTGERQPSERTTTLAQEAGPVVSGVMDEQPSAGTMDTSGAPKVREIIAAMTSAAERDLQRNTAQHNAAKSPAANAAGAGESPDPDGAPEVGLTQTPEPCTLYLENIFTPNNDGVNDGYVVKAPPCITSASIRIFSMNGQLVHIMNNYEPWTGANSEEGWYIVAGEARTTEGNVIPVKGTVYLKRSGNN